MQKRQSKPGAIHLRIVEVLKRFPGGASGGQIRQELEKAGLKPEDQTHLDRRKRDLKKWFLIEKIKIVQDVNGKKQTVTLYKFVGEKKSVGDEGQVSLRIRAQVLHAAHGRCQMCGETVGQHGITLVVDHKIPRDWAGTNEIENLWALCERCNSGKKAHFSSHNASSEAIKKAVSHESVHVRIGELLKAVGIGKRVSSSVLQVVSDQEDWHKRLRELRYPVIGWEIETVRYKGPSGKVQVDYILKSYRPWPDDPSGTIRKFEKEREEKNKEELD